MPTCAAPLLNLHSRTIEISTHPRRPILDSLSFWLRDYHILVSRASSNVVGATSSNKASRPNIAFKEGLFSLARAYSLLHHLAHRRPSTKRPLIRHWRFRSQRPMISYTFIRFVYYDTDTRCPVTDEVGISSTPSNLSLIACKWGGFLRLRMSRVCTLFRLLSLYYHLDASSRTFKLDCSLPSNQKCATTLQ